MPARFAPRWVRSLAALAMSSLLTACAGSPPEPGPPRSSLQDQSAGWITFQTTTPYDFPDMIAGTAPQATIQGQLVMPEGDGPVRGAAILSHGSGGLGARQRRMAERLASAGIAAFALDHFGARGITSTAKDQLKLTAQAMLVDAKAAKALLASHPRIPAERIGLIGWSKGGIVAVLGAVGRTAAWAADASQTGPFAFAAAFYPFCGFDLGDEPLSAPLLMLLGGADNWTPPKPCEDLSAAWSSAGQPARAVVFPGAPHGFDSGLPGSFDVGQAITVRDRSERCVLTLSEDGGTETQDGAHRLTNLPARQAYLADCGVRGVRFGGDRAARSSAYAELDRFLGEHLP